MPPIPVQRIVHIAHAVRDLSAARQRYMDTFGAWVFAEGYFAQEDRDMNLMYVADLMVEPIAPRSPSGVLGRYLKRFGEGLHSIEFGVEDLEAGRRALEAHGVRIASAHRSYVFAHPKDTHGVFYILSNAPMPNDPARYRGWDPNWIAGHPSSLERLACITYAVTDLDPASRHLRDVLGARVLRHDETPGLERAWLSIGGSVLCLARPATETSPVAEYIRRRGPGMYSVVWKVARLSDAERHMLARGMHVTREGCVAGTWGIAPEDFFGARHEFTENTTPQLFR